MTSNGMDPMVNNLQAQLDQLREEHLAHLKDCLEERRSAAKNRHDFRAEVATSMTSLRTEMTDGFNRVMTSISKIHERINNTDSNVHTVDKNVHTVDKQADRRVVGWIVTGLGAAVLAMAGYILRGAL